jgi:hypothetical protein
MFESDALHGGSTARRLSETEPPGGPWGKPIALPTHWLPLPPGIVPGPCLKGDEGHPSAAASMRLEEYVLPRPPLQW